MRTELSRKVEAEVRSIIEDRSASLIKGAATSMDDYQNRVGFVKGLRQVLDIMDEIETKMLGGEKEK